MRTSWTSICCLLNPAGCRMAMKMMMSRLEEFLRQMTPPFPALDGAACFREVDSLLDGRGGMQTLPEGAKNDPTGCFWVIFEMFKVFKDLRTAYPTGAPTSRRPIVQNCPAYWSSWTSSAGCNRRDVWQNCFFLKMLDV